MHRSRLAALVLDSQVDDIQQANNFWESALGFKCINSNEDWSSKYTHLRTPKDQPQVLIQKVSHASRVHLDIETDNIQAEVQRLTQLGATVVETFPRWVVMQAPTGHKFCVVNPQREDFESAKNVNVWEE